MFHLVSPSTMNSLEMDLYRLKPKVVAVLSVVSSVGCLSCSPMVLFYFKPTISKQMGRGTCLKSRKGLVMFQSLLLVCLG